MSSGNNPLSPEQQNTAPLAGEAQQGVSPPGQAVAEDPPWGIGGVVRIAVVAAVAIGFFSMIAMGVAILTAGPVRASASDLARNPRVVVPAQFAAYLVVVIYMVWLVRSPGRRFWTAIRWHWPRVRWFGWAGLGVALALFVQAASALLPIPKSLPIDRYFRDTAGAYMMAVFGLTFAPLVEELFFRGFMYPALARRLGMIAAVLITAALFAFIHTSQLANAWAPLLLLFLVGVVLTAVRARTGSVATTFLVHVGYNGTLFTLLYVASDAFRHLEKVS
ncbi:MAG: CPBP family intramembrane metalloprotease [Acidobacteriia bacterium]|nr:CPBP family intramembrane metalloprotease [Terriglobia bacterium]